MVRVWLAVAALLWLVGCGDSESGEETSASGGGDMDPGDDGCPAGTRPLDDGACQPAGVSACAPGFELVDGSCEATLPSQPCGWGTVALPGETSCRELGDCGTTTWGNIDDDAGTQYVDGSFTGQSDGSKTSPWTTVQQGVDAAAPGAVVALAAGSYSEQVTVIDDPVVLWGRCASMVAISGTTANEPAIDVRASGTVVRDVAVTSNGAGISTIYGDDLLMERIWAHDCVETGIEIFNGSGVVRDVLVEAVADSGIVFQAADGVVERAVVRDLVPNVDRYMSEGVTGWTAFGMRARITVRESLIERAIGAGIGAQGIDVVVDGSLIRDTQPLEDGGFGHGITAFRDATQDAASTLSVSRTVIDGNAGMGIFVGSGSFDMTDTVVRNTLPQSTPTGMPFDFGWGVVVQAEIQTGAVTVGHIDSSVVERNNGLGIANTGGDVTLEGVLVRDIAPQALDGKLGRGINAQHNLVNLAPATLTVRYCAVERVHELGIGFMAGTFEIASTAVRDIEPQADGTIGRGIAIQDNPDTLAPAVGTVSDSSVERCYEGGLFVISSDATVERLQVADVRATVNDGTYGDGVVVMSYAGPASATLTDVTVERSERAGIANFGATLTLQDSTLSCNAIHLDGEVYQSKDFSFDDRGGNVCSCEASEECRVVSSNLQPPLPLGAPGM